MTLTMTEPAVAAPAFIGPAFAGPSPVDTGTVQAPAAAVPETVEDVAPPTVPHRGAKWRILYDALRELGPGGLLSYEDMAALLGEDYDDVKARNRIYSSGRRAVQEMLNVDGRVFKIHRGLGYHEANAKQVLQAVVRHQGRALAETDRAVTKVRTVDPSQLDHTTAETVRATELLISQQQQAMRALDVRQKRVTNAAARLRNGVLPMGLVSTIQTVDVKPLGERPAVSGAAQQHQHPE
jgi:hypothetical protein